MTTQPATFARKENAPAASPFLQMALNSHGEWERHVQFVRRTGFCTSRPVPPARLLHVLRDWLALLTRPVRAGRRAKLPRK